VPPFPNPPLAPLSIVAGQALKLNATGDGWVAFTPGEGGGVGEVLSLSYWDGTGQSAPFDVPCYGVPASYAVDDSLYVLGAVLTVGAGGITSGILLDADEDPIPDGWTFTATIFVIDGQIVDILAFSPFQNLASGGLLTWNAEGGAPAPVYIAGGIQTPGGIVAGGVVTPFFELDGVIFSVYAGDPNTHVTSASKGDVVVDTATPAVWQATVATSATSWVQLGGGGADLTVNSGALVSSGELPLQITKQPLVPPSGIIQPLPALIGFEFPGVALAYSSGLSGNNDTGFIAAGRDGNVWTPIAGVDNKGVVRWTLDGVPTFFAIAGSDTPYGICSGSDGNLYVVDLETTPPNVYQISTAGSLLNTFAITGAGQLSGICAGPDGNLWAADRDNALIWRITTAGVATSFALTAGRQPETICAGPDGNLWATGYPGYVWRITPAGSIAEHLIGFDHTLISICTGPDGNLYVTDQTSSAILQISTAGVLLNTFTLTGGALPEGICVGAGGDLWAPDISAHVLWKLTTEGVATSFALPSPGAGWICAAADGSLWLSTGDTSGSVIVTPFTVVMGGLKITGPVARGLPVVRAFPFAFDTADILTGAPLYTPTVGDVLLDAWIEVDTPWNGTTPLGDFSSFVGGNIGMLASIGPTACNMTVPDTAGITSFPGFLNNGTPGTSLLDALLNGGTAPTYGRDGVGKFTTAAPIKVCVSQDGTNTGSDPGSTQGAAVLYVVTVTPA
jgi:virginiamycin B lyase